MPEVKDNFLAKLGQIETRYNEIERQISDPAIARDSARLVALSKEKGKLKALVTKYREYRN